MSKTILVCGYGPGISNAVAERFGAGGFAVALAARSADKVSAGVKALEAKGIRAAGFPTDLADPAAARALVGKVRDALGPLTAVEWNAYSSAAGDLLTADAPALRGALDIAVTSLLAVTQAALPDLKQQRGAVLVVNGGLGYFDENVDAAAVQWNTMGLAVANAAKHKVVGLLSQKLKPDNVYVGEVMVLGSVKGSSFDSGDATIEARTVAAKLWDLFTARADVTSQIG